MGAYAARHIRATLAEYRDTAEASYLALPGINSP